MLYALPPAGDPIRLRPGGGDPSLEEFVAPRLVRYYDSGTASLAAALVAAARLRGVPDPEVVLPAYACPDLISAVLHAGARPVLVDLAPGRPWLSLEGVAAALNPQTVAVIAVHLFGIRERLRELRALLRGHDALLIEDSAQAVPAMPAEECLGDYVVLSFGRGKPVSLLGGGAVLAADARLAEQLPPPESAGGTLGFGLKALLYNGLRRPQCYWLPQAIPGLGLGETRFEPLRSIGALDGTRLRLLPANLAAYRRRGSQPQRWLERMMSELDSWGVESLAGACQSGSRLLRFPLLFETPALREAAYAALAAQGLGPARMYPASLPCIAGVAPHLHRCGDYPHADDFAGRILTLPTHSGVRRRDVERAGAVLRRVLEVEFEQAKSIRAREG